MKGPAVESTSRSESRVWRMWLVIGMAVKCGLNDSVAAASRGQRMLFGCDCCWWKMTG
jgi:hypothetical protein